MTKLRLLSGDLLSGVMIGFLVENSLIFCLRLFISSQAASLVLESVCLSLSELSLTLEPLPFHLQNTNTHISMNICVRGDFSLC